MNDPPDREAAVFSAARRVPAGQRAAYLDQACAGDAGLRQRVEELIRANEEAGGFLQELAPEAQQPPDAAVPPSPGATLRRTIAGSEKAGDRIGRYKLLEPIGEGGCGIVYLAEQAEPIRRKVALKVIKLGMDTESVIARFEAERQALALMDHPNIAKVLDAGATDAGRPYFVMELVRGVKITDFCDQNNLCTRERLELFTQICRAIQHAHQKGIIHRDIKPSNILVAVNDGVAVPMVIDFGIAKATQGRLTDQTLFTAFEQFLGTPAYMSPEQAVMTNLDIDTRSDIYSLGVLLYELLTSKTPFEGKELLAAGLDEMRRTIREKEPARPSTRLSTMQAEDATAAAKHRQTDAPILIHTLRGDLDWIVMKALEKDRARRYETANGLAMDIQRHLNDEPVVARPPTRLYLFRKLVRRNKFVFAGGAVVTVSLLLGLGAATVAVFRVQRDNQQIRQAKDDATEKLLASYLAEARALRSSGRAGQRFDSLDAVRRAAAIRPDPAVRNEAIASLAVSDVRLSRQTTNQWRDPEALARVDFKLERYAIGEANGNISIHAVAEDRTLGVLPAPGFALQAIRGFSPNSRFLKARYWREPEGENDWVWDLERRVPVLKALPGNLAADFSSDSRFFTKCNPDLTLSLYDLGSGKETRRLPGGRQITILMLSPADTWLACSSDLDSTIEIRDVESGQTIAAWPCPAPVDAIAWSPEGKRLATACNEHRIYIWDAETGKKLAQLDGTGQRIMNVAFNHAGNLLASSSFEGQYRFWDPDTGRQIASYPGASWYFQFSLDDRYLEGWQEVSRFGLLEVASSRECRLLSAQDVGEVWSDTQFSADGRMLAAATGDRMRFLDVFSGKEIASFPLPVCDTQIFHPDGRSLIVIDRSGGVRLRSLERTGDPARYAYRLGKPRRFYDVQELRKAALSLDGRHLAVTHRSEGESFIFDLQDPSAKPVILKPHPWVDYIAISPDGRWAATGSWLNPLVMIWDARSGGDPVCTLQMPARTTVAFSPDGRWLATSTTEYQLWEVGSWRRKGPPLPGHPVAQFNFTAFSPDGRVMARTMDAHKIRLSEVLTAKPLATLEAPGSSGVWTFQFSPDGTQLAVLLHDRQFQLWDLRLIRQELEAMHLDWDLPPYLPVEQTAAAGPVSLEVESDSASQADLSAIPARDTNAAPNLIDLSAHYNFGLTKTWHSGNLNNSLINLPSGVQTLAGTAFDLRGLIQLRGESTAESVFLEQAAGIRVDRQCRELHFLHATQRSVSEGIKIGHYVVHYADGSEVSLPIIYGQNIRDWWVKSGEPTGPEALLPAWSGSNADSKSLGTSIRLFKWTWKNPCPNLQVLSLDFVSEKTPCAPFLVAITVE
ncbi:MAG TPA: WD40 repeat domain-containing serine/threonine-protein kinase [Candidatus Binatia bacterium]|jgi:serine/threonine protein kinase/WD40 repeat protein|nr:WD40 repeat domain-containing serine/threonine-protein kinase [Candidatus Binatia bacterium]